MLICPNFLSAKRTADTGVPSTATVKTREIFSTVGEQVLKHSSAYTYLSLKLNQRLGTQPNRKYTGRTPELNSFEQQAMEHVIFSL